MLSIEVHLAAVPEVGVEMQRLVLTMRGQRMVRREVHLEKEERGVQAGGRRLLAEGRRHPSPRLRFFSSVVCDCRQQGALGDVFFSAGAQAAVVMEFGC